MKITTNMIVVAYDYAKKVYKKELSLSSALDKLEQVHGMNRGSATDYIYNFRHMLEGERYTRTNNAEATEYFLKNILSDYGVKALGEALFAVDQHIKYYKVAGKSDLPGIRRIYDKYYELAKVVSVKSHSWVVKDSLAASKILDKSAFLHKGTGVPVDVRTFFIDGEMEPRESRPVTLECFDKNYDAHIDMDDHLNPRTRLFWNAHFSTLLKDTFPHHYHQYCNDEKPDSKIVLKFERVFGFDRYRVSFAGNLSDSTVADDVEANELEDNGPQSEGKVREYYGKRYERSPKNRKEAIRIHGLSCNACDFSFEKAYGKRGADYIEVHHVKPIHTYEESQPVDPRTDLITVCSNCHRMIHRKPNDILSVADVKAIFQKKVGA